MNLLKSGWAKPKIRMLWWGIAAISAIAAGLGFVVVNNVDSATGAVVSAFAAGALLTMIADEMAPEAYERSQIYAGLPRLLVSPSRPSSHRSSRPLDP